MFENDHMNDFDLQVRSILEQGKEEVPASVWDGVSAGLDKAARGKVISLWLRRAGFGVAAAAAAVAGFLFINSENNTDFVPPVSEEMIAVVEDTAIPAENTDEEIITVVNLPKAAKLISKASEPESSVPAAQMSAEQPSAERPSAEQPSAKRYSAEQPVTEVVEKETTSSWIEDKEPKKRRINTSLVISGIAGTNSPSAAAKSVIFRSPALDRAPSTTIVQQTGSEISYGIPVSFGLGAKINLTKRWALSAGVNYTLLTSRFDGKYISVNEDVIVSEKSAKIKNMQHYIGVPVSVYYNIIDHDFINFYAHAGGAVEKCILNKYEVHTSPVIYHTQAVESVQLSANAGIGVEFMLGKHVGIYLDPSLRYYFKGNQPKSIRTAQPLMLGFEAGLRFNL